MNQFDYKEIEEAINAGEMLLRKINEAQSLLNSARNWGIFDMFSRRSFISSWIKHSKLDDAQTVLNQLPYYIERFNDELDDIHISDELCNARMSDGVRFADWFFDGFLVDAYVLSHISDSANQLEQLKDQVERTLNKLYSLRR